MCGQSGEGGGEVLFNPMSQRGMYLYLNVPLKNNCKSYFILLAFLQTWMNAVPQSLSVTSLPRVKIPLVHTAAHVSKLDLRKMVKVALVNKFTIHPMKQSIAV